MNGDESFVCNNKNPCGKLVGSVLKLSSGEFRIIIEQRVKPHGEVRLDLMF
jgi:hypothetical protein